MLRFPALLLSLFVAGFPAAAGADEAPDRALTERIAEIERLNAERPWPESQAAIEALRESPAFEQAGMDDRSRLDLVEARNRMLAGRPEAAMDRLDAVLARPVPIDRRLRALELAANLAGLQQRYAAAFNYLYEGLKLLPQSQNPGPRADLLVLASRFHALAGEQALAMEYISEALEAADAAGDARRLCYAEQDLVYLQIRAGLTGLAVQTAGGMWATCQLRVDPVLNGAGMMAMGAALLHAGRYDEAIGWLERAVARQRDNAFSIGVAESSYYLGLALLRAGRAERGVPLLLLAAEHFERVEDWQSLIELHAELAAAFEARGDYDRALDQLRALLRADARFNDTQRSLRIAYQQAEFENQRQQQELELLRQRNELFELERETESSRRLARGVATGMAGLIGVLLVGLLVRFRADRRRFRRLSERDGLTGLLNHSRFHRRAEAVLRDARQSGRPCTLIAADVDLFKQVNDRHGHQAGDAVLAYLGRLLAETFPSPCIVGRVGGEEFAMFLPGENRLQARQRVETLRRRLEPVDLGDARVEITLSFGIAEARRDGRLERLRLRADDALYRAKRAGRDQLVDASELIGEEPAGVVRPPAKSFRTRA